MYLIEIFLPLADNDGKKFAAQMYHDEQDILVKRFGGITAFTRAPAVGLWREGQSQDDIVILETMTTLVDHAWWRDYRTALENRFRQTAVLIRATQTERL